jgi:anti-sigma factor RsiW
MAANENAALSACPAMEADLVLYYYGDLGFDARKSVEAHLGDCGRCRAYVDDLRSFLPRTVAADEPPDSFWLGYRREMRQKLDDASDSKSWWQRIVTVFQPWPVPAIATAALVGIALAVTFSNRVEEPVPPKENQALIELLPVAENLEFFTNMDVLDSMDLLEDMNGQANGTS